MTYAFPEPPSFPLDQPKIYYSDSIADVIIAQLARYPDERGFFMEGTRSRWFNDMRIKQVSFGYRHTGVANGWHIHRKHDEVLIALTGSVRLVFRDCRESHFQATRPDGDEEILRFPESTTWGAEEWYLAGEHHPLAIFVPRGVAHGYRVFDSSLMVYQSSQDYDPDDEFRIAPDRWGTAWSSDPVIK